MPNPALVSNHKCIIASLFVQRDFEFLQIFAAGLNDDVGIVAGIRTIFEDKILQRPGGLNSQRAIVKNCRQDAPFFGINVLDVLKVKPRNLSDKQGFISNLNQAAVSYRSEERRVGK